MKHCFMIMAHNEPELLSKLCSQIDKKGNVIVIHIDKKSNFDFSNVNYIVKKATLKFVEDRVSIYWATTSQMICEYALFNEAIKYEWDYCHLISGQDLLLKPYEEFDKFFEDNKGKEFFGIDKVALESKSFYDRLKYYWLIKDKHNIWQSRLERKVLIPIQKLLKVNRIKNCDINFCKGNNWFSSTRAFLQYALTKEKENKKRYKYTNFIDEVFLLTDLYNSNFYKNNYGSLLYTDWSKGLDSPEVLTENHYETLISSGKMFGRKFNYTSSPQVVDKILEYTNN